MEIKFLAILTTGLVGFAIGFLWYMPQLFGKAWMKAVGMSDGDMNKQGMVWKMIASLVASFIVAIVLSVFRNHVTGMLLVLDFRYQNLNHVAIGALAGAWVWLGFFATSLIDPVLWQNKPWSLWCINAGHWLVRLVAMGMTLGAFGPFN